MEKQKADRLKALKFKYRYQFIKDNFIPDVSKIKRGSFMGFEIIPELFRVRMNLLKYNLKHFGKVN